MKKLSYPAMSHEEIQEIQFRKDPESIKPDAIMDIHAGDSNWHISETISINRDLGRSARIITKEV